MEASNSFWSEEHAAAFTQLMLRETRQYGVIFYDPSLHITGWNEGAHFITGWTATEVLAQSTSTLFVPEDLGHKLHEHEANTARLIGTAEDERWHMRKDGSRFWSSGVSLSVKSPQGQVIGFVKIFRDATHLRSRMKYLENVLQESRTQQDDVNVFIGTIAHEMRNPLAPLKTALELMKRLPQENPRHAHPLTVMDRQVGFLERLVEDLIDLTRVKAGKMSIVYAEVELQKLLGEALDSCREGAAAKGIHLQQVMPSIPVYVEADTVRLLQVVLNLLNNAIKYTQAGGTIWLTATIDQTHFFCYVKDNGRGISPELLPKIFEIFTQAGNPSATRGAGLGIGLAVVKEIVALHQGTVEVRSEGSGKGSEFIVRIPLRRPSGPGSEPFLAPEPPAEKCGVFCKAKFTLGP